MDDSPLVFYNNKIIRNMSFCLVSALTVSQLAKQFFNLVTHSCLLASFVFDGCTFWLLKDP